MTRPHVGAGLSLHANVVIAPAGSTRGACHRFDYEIRPRFAHSQIRFLCVSLCLARRFGRTLIPTSVATDADDVWAVPSSGLSATFSPESGAEKICGLSFYIPEFFTALRDGHAVKLLRSAKNRSEIE